MSFLDMAQDLMRDAEAKAEFDADPDAFLAARGFEGLSPAEVGDAVGFVADTLPADAARQLTDPEAGTEGLARLADLEPGDVLTDEPPDFLEHDPSGELDLPDDGAEPDGLDASGQEDPMAADAPTHDGADDDLDPDPVATHHVGAEESGFWRPDENEQDPGFGVGYTAEDVDDVSPAAPEVANLAEHPLDLTLDATHVPDLALDAADPISQAFAYAEHDDTAAHHADAVEHDAGDDAAHDDGADHHHHDLDHDGHLDF